MSSWDLTPLQIFIFFKMADNMKFRLVNFV
jgi:hypothetical protein